MTEPLENRLVLYAALGANLGIAVAKFCAAAISGSSAMLAEGFHSIVDSLNQLLLLYGQKRAARLPDPRYPLGYARERYFWSFVVAILVFWTGAGLSIHEGIAHIRYPEAIRAPYVSYIVLAVAFALEAGSWVVAMREFGEVRAGQGWWEVVRQSNAPSSFMVLFEDCAAMFGLAIAAIGISLSLVTGDPRWDGMASVVIGIALASVALALTRESRRVLIGEPADPAIEAAVRAAVGGRPEVAAVNEITMIHLGPKNIFVGLSVDFDKRVPAGRIEAMIAEAEAELRERWPSIRAIYIKPQARRG